MSHLTTCATTVRTMKVSQEEIGNRETIAKKMKECDPVHFVDVCEGSAGVKLSFGNPKFFEIGDTVVKCVLPVKMLAQRDQAWLFREFGANMHALNNSGLMESDEINFEGYAACHNEDIDRYDFEIGKKISLIKAKNNAYRTFAGWTRDICEDLHKNLAILASFGNRMDNLNVRNIDYLIRFDESLSKGARII